MTNESTLSVEEFEDHRVSARLNEIHAMEDSNDPGVLSRLANAMFDPNLEVKLAALQTLSDKEGKKVTYFIRQGLTDADAEFRMEVLEALADRGDIESIRHAKFDPDEAIRERAADIVVDAEQQRH